MNERAKRENEESKLTDLSYFSWKDPRKMTNKELAEDYLNNNPHADVASKVIALKMACRM